MAYARLVFNSQTLAIMNMVDPGETINYDWSIDEDYSIVLLEGSVTVNGNVLEGVIEHRVQPNEQLSMTGTGDTRSYCISLFRVDDDTVMDQIVSETGKTRMRTFEPTWIDAGWPSDPDTTWGDDFTSGNYTYTKAIVETQIANSEWD